MTLPPLPEPDTHCFDDDTGLDVWSHSPDQMRAYGEACAAAERERLTTDCAGLRLALNRAESRIQELLAESQGEPVAWHVCSVNKDGSLSLEFAAPWEELAHEHINDAINEHDIDGATSWVVRPVYASPQPQQTEPAQDTPCQYAKDVAIPEYRCIGKCQYEAHPPQQRPPTPIGWSDTDWLAHLQTMPPIAYAVRDTLYGTCKAGVLRFCAADEPGAFAVYASPPQQRRPLTMQQGEPVAWRSRERVNGDFDTDWILTKSEPPQTPRTVAIEPLYAAPQQRRPLTDKEIIALPEWDDYVGGCITLLAFARAVERTHGIGGGE